MPIRTTHKEPAFMKDRLQIDVQKPWVLKGTGVPDEASISAHVQRLGKNEFFNGFHYSQLAAHPSFQRLPQRERDNTFSAFHPQIKRSVSSMSQIAAEKLPKGTEFVVVDIANSLQARTITPKEAGRQRFEPGAMSYIQETSRMPSKAIMKHLEERERVEEVKDNLRIKSVKDIVAHDIPRTPGRMITIIHEPIVAVRQKGGDGFRRITEKERERFQIPTLQREDKYVLGGQGDFLYHINPLPEEQRAKGNKKGPPIHTP